MSNVVRKQQPIPVIIGTRNGEYIRVMTDAFHPARFCQVVTETRRILQPDTLAFVAFPDTNLTDIQVGSSFQVHLEGDWKLEIELLFEDDDRMGFYARGVGSEGSMFFFHDAVVELVELDPVVELVLEDVEEAPVEEARPRTRLRLGELLIDEGLITTEELETALDLQKTLEGKRLGQILLETGKLSEQALFVTLARAFRLELVDIDLSLIHI